jgi:hypothetical protein
VADPWLMAVLVVLAAGCEAAGARLGVGGSGFHTALTSAVPQLAGLVVVARLIAAIGTASVPPGTASGT